MMLRVPKEFDCVDSANLANIFELMNPPWNKSL